MRILHFYKTALPDTMGGVEQVIHQLAIGCQQHSIQTDVLSLTSKDAPNPTEMNGYTVHRVPQDFHIASTGFSLSAFSRFKQLAQKADVIHYHFPWPFMDLVHIASHLKKPTVVTYHSDIVRQKYLLQLYRPLMHLFLRDVNCIAATSPNYVTTSEALQIYADKVRVIPIGLDKNSYPTPQPERMQYWQKQVGEKFFLFVGVLRYYKGLHILLQALKECDYPVVIVGEGPVEQALKKQASQLGLRNIHFLGQQSDEDKVALTTLCHGIVFPSHLRSEAFGISLLEGAMYGKPMIACEIGTGTTYINIHNETGLVVPPNNPLALRQAMQYLWDHPDIAQTMGQQAQARYTQYFTAEKMVKAYVDLYQTLLAKKSL